MPRTTFLLGCLLLFSRVTLAQTTEKAVFDAHCARCHGIGGTGGEGPSLARPVLRHAGDDETLAAVITEGIPGTDMPDNWMLGAAEVEQLVRYVRSLSRVERTPVPGDPVRGKALFEGKGACSLCHIVAGEGGTLGPELTRLGAARGVRYLEESLIAPGVSVAERYVVVRAVAKDGRVIEGLRVNEDSFTLQIRDDSGRYHSLNKLELESLEKKFGASLMPSYQGELSPSEIDDVVSYLASLRGEP